MGLLPKMTGGIRWLGGLILPVFAHPRDVRALGKLRWVMHFGLLTFLLLGLGFLNYALELEKLLDAPLPFLRKIWLPMLFFIIYLLSWLGWWLWVLLGAEEEISDVHADIDAAWEEAVATLKQAGIDVHEVPLFLVLGQPMGSEQSLFSGAQLELTVEHAPRSPEAPLRVYANAEAIFVTCADASLLGRQAQLYLDEKVTTGEVKPSAAGDESLFGMPSQSALKAAESVAATAAEPASSLTLTMGSQALVVEKEPSARKAPARQPLLKNTVEAERLSARLRHLCWLILKERRPYCPINGILLLVPFAGTQNDAEANQTGLVCQRDVHVVREIFQINCPLFGLVCDMENAPGFREFMERFPKGHRQRRLGQQFPYVAGLNLAAGSRLIDSGVQWICQELFPPLVYRLMRLDKGSHDKISPVLRGNMHLYDLLCQMRERRKRLGRLLSLAIAGDSMEPILFGGCYIAATGHAPREQAFIAAVFHRLLENQNFVSWTHAANVEEADYRRWVRYGYTALITFTVSLLVMGYTFVLRP